MHMRLPHPLRGGGGSNAYCCRHGRRLRHPSLLPFTRNQQEQTGSQGSEAETSSVITIALSSAGQDPCRQGGTDVEARLGKTGHKGTVTVAENQDNLDANVVRDFGSEWSRFDQS